MAEKFRSTCWQNWNEWISVYEKIYSFGDQKIQAEGLRIIDTWRSRSEGKTPLAIECTAGLVAADIGLGQITRGLSLAMALVRFVNGMVDQGNRLGLQNFSILNNSLHKFHLIRFPFYWFKASPDWIFVLRAQDIARAGTYAVFNLGRAVGNKQRIHCFIIQRIYCFNLLFSTANFQRSLA